MWHFKVQWNNKLTMAIYYFLHVESIPATNSINFSQSDKDLRQLYIYIYIYTYIHTHTYILL